MCACRAAEGHHEQESTLNQLLVEMDGQFRGIAHPLAPLLHIHMVFVECSASFSHTEGSVLFLY